MWPFLNEEHVETIPERFVSLAASEGIFDGIKLDIEALVTIFRKILYTHGGRTHESVTWEGKICSRDRFLQIRMLAHGDFLSIPMSSHVQRAVENFQEFPALRGYDINHAIREHPEEARNRAYVRDVAVVLTHVLAESLATIAAGLEAVISDLVGQLLQVGRRAKLWLAFAPFVNATDDFALQEVTYGTLFYLVALQSSEAQWQLYERWYAELPDELQLDIRLMETKALAKGGLHPADIETVESMRTLAPLSRSTVALLSGCGTESDKLWHIDWQLEIQGGPHSDDAGDIREDGDDDAIDEEANDCRLELDGFELVRNFDVERKYKHSMTGVKHQPDKAEACLESPETPKDLCKMVGVYLQQHAFKEAVSCLKRLIDLVNVDGTDLVLKEQLQLVLGYAALRSSDRDLMRKARQLLKAVKVHPGMVLLWIAELKISACQFDEAQSSLENASFEVVVVPETDVVLHPTNLEEFEAVRSSLLIQLENSPQPDHLCCNATSCSHREIFERSLDFAGLVRVHCEEGCVLVLHPGCWKATVGLLAGEKTKHGTGAQCCTPDCHGRINLLTIFNSRMEIAKEYRWTGSSRKSGLQDDEGPTSEGQESNRKMQTLAMNKLTPMATTHQDEVVEALRCTIASAGHSMSVSELVDVCADLCGYDRDFVSSLVTDTLGGFEPGTHPEWNRAQWLGAVQDFLLDLDPIFWPNINASLSSTVICEALSAEEIVRINEEYTRSENEFEDLLNEEVLLRNQIVQENLQSDEDTEFTALEQEIQDLERQCTLITSAEARIDPLTRRVALKQDVLSNLDVRLQEAKKKMQKVLVEDRQENEKYQLIVNDRTELAKTVSANACEARSRLRRALIELVQNRYHLAVDAVECVEQAVAANLREIERIQDPRVNRVNRTAKIDHFKLMKEMRERSKSMKKETGQLMERLRAGHLDPLEAAPASFHEPVSELITRYAMLPRLYRRVQDATLSNVARSLPEEV